MFLLSVFDAGKHSSLRWIITLQNGWSLFLEVKLTVPWLHLARLFSSGGGSDCIWEAIGQIFGTEHARLSNVPLWDGLEYSCRRRRSQLGRPR